MRNQNFSLLLILAMIAFVILAGCSGKHPYPADVEKTLKAAGDNRAELEKVLMHFASPEDSLKLRAAYFLIGNMEGHCYVTYDLIDSLGEPVEFEVLDYENYDDLLTAVDSIEDLRGELDYDKKEKIFDMDKISSDFLIRQIEYAFKAWREKPWARDFSFDDFCAYILPYRGSNEPLEDWRELFLEKYVDIQEQMTDESDPIEAATLINDDIRSWFSFDPRYYYHPTDQGLAEMLDNKMGRCEDMTNISIYAMRANGLAITSDYTPHWASTGNNHAWNAIVTPDGKAIPFMGAESNPGEYRLANKFAKVYRKMYAQKPDNLAFLDQQQEKTPRWLSGKSYIDVTDDYIDVCDVTIRFEEAVPDSVDIAYLCVFNSGEWKAIHWGKIEGDKTMFTDMGPDIVYLPALYINEEIFPFGKPFILEEDCDIRQFHTEADKTITSESSTAVRISNTSNNGVSETPIVPGREYEMFYWDNEWKSLGTSVAENGSLVYENVPDGNLFWLVVEDSDREERIFSIENGKQIWW